MPTNESGNVAKLREALETILFTARECDAQYMANALEAIMESASAALAAPPRNCDRFDDDDDAFAAWHDSLVDGDVVCVRNGFRWLFAPAAQEGGPKHNNQEGDDK